MDEGVSAELQALRARAYAPGGDIAHDAAALARLTELEERERDRRIRRMPGSAAASAGETASAPGPPLPATIESVPALASERETEAEAEQEDRAEQETGAGAGAGADRDAGADAEPAGVPDDGEVGAGRLRGRPLRSMLAWAGSLVAVAVLAVGVTAFATARTASTATALPEDARVSHVTTLLPTGTDLPAFFGSYADGRDGRSFEPFYGLAVFETDTFWAPDEGDDSCVFVTRVSDVESSTNDSWSGFMNQGCSAGAFPASVSFVVRDDQPEELLSRYPAGTALQFVLTDAGVDVFVSDAPPSTAAPSSGSSEPQPAG